MSARPTLARWLLPMLLALTLPALEGCGRKPKLLDPPEGAGPEAAQFPRSYPVSKSGPPKGAQPEPLQPAEAYPQIIRPETLGDPTALSAPGQGGVSGWSNSSRNQP